MQLQHSYISKGRISSYSFGFNGKEKLNEAYGEGNAYDYGFRMYDPRIGRFMSVDPLAKDYPMLTPYQFASNTPIMAIDIDGLEAVIVIYNKVLLKQIQKKIDEGDVIGAQEIIYIAAHNKMYKNEKIASFTPDANGINGFDVFDAEGNHILGTVDNIVYDDKQLKVKFFESVISIKEKENEAFEQEKREINYQIRVLESEEAEVSKNIQDGSEGDGGGHGGNYGTVSASMVYGKLIRALEDRKDVVNEVIKINNLEIENATTEKNKLTTETEK